MKSKSAEFKIGTLLIMLFLLIAVISVFYTPHDAYEMKANMKLQAPSLEVLFGTDNLGRDIFSRTMIGVRYSLTFSGITLFLSATIGITIGLVASRANRFLDQFIMRVVDAINSIPTILLALVLLSVFAGGNVPLIIAMVVIFTPAFVRMTRNEAIQIKELEYIQHAEVLGASNFRIMFIHTLPNIYPSLLSTGIIVITNSIMVESALSYLGVGIQPPIPSLGRMMYDAQSYLFNAPWGAILPGIAIVLLISGFNYLGEGIRKLY
jgi:ABC-type dipeptide/oligopeptide/nickel transport systems, permease components